MKIIPVPFQSPEGGSLGLQVHRAYVLRCAGCGFQSPEGGSLGLQAHCRWPPARVYSVSVPRRGQPRAARMQRRGGRRFNSAVSVPRRGQPRAARMAAPSGGWEATSFSPPKGAA